MGGIGGVDTSGTPKVSPDTIPEGPMIKDHINSGVPNASELGMDVGPTTNPIRGVPKDSALPMLGGESTELPEIVAFPNDSADAIELGCTATTLPIVAEPNASAEAMLDAVTVWLSSSVSGGNGSCADSLGCHCQLGKNVLSLQLSIIHLRPGLLRSERWLQRWRSSE